MRRYFDYAFFWDIAICVVFTILLYSFKSTIQQNIHVPSMESINKMGDSIIKVSASIIGFLLTVTTVIVTFKRGFIDKAIRPHTPPTTQDIPEPTKTIFDENISKETQFYGTALYVKVAHVFIYATLEIGFLLFLLLAMQLEIISLNKMEAGALTVSSLILLILSVIRSFFIFQKFLKVHLPDK